MGLRASPWCWRCGTLFQEGCVFQGGWGVWPTVTVVPDSWTWDRAVPAWLQGRHDEVVARLRTHPDHVVVEERDDSAVVNGCDEVTR